MQVTWISYSRNIRGILYQTMNFIKQFLENFSKKQCENDEFYQILGNYEILRTRGR